MNNRKAFTIVELLTSVTIIALLLGILLPSISMVRTKARDVAQKAQLGTIDMALDAFKQDYGDYPPSNWFDWSLPMPVRNNYCGAPKLAEALLGWDLMGFHPKSAWRSDGYTGTTYPVGGANSYDPDRIRRVPPVTGQPETLKERKNPYLEVATANAFRLGQLFNNTGPLNSNAFVLCDIYKVRKTIDGTGKVVTAGAPILYYKANTSSKILDPNIALPVGERIYEYADNNPLVQLGKLTANGTPGLAHPFAYLPGNNFPVFYSDKYNYTPGAIYGGSGTGYGIRDTSIVQNQNNWPYRPDSFILISAGADGYYGTADDIHNY